MPKRTTEAVAGIFLIGVGLAAAQNAQNGTLGDWLGAKFLNRGEIPPLDPAGIARGGPVPDVDGTPAGVTGSTCGGYSNGNLPASALAGINEGGHRLAPSAASAYLAMKAAAAQDGVSLRVTDSYRTLAGQIECTRNKGSLCATPGTSKHGCGIAIDVASGGGRREWVQQNGDRYGWHWPSWARPTGSKPEPWHFEYQGVAGPAPV